MTISSILLVLIVFLSYSSISISYPTFGSKATSQFVNQVCSKTAKAKLCIFILNANPKTPSTDISGLCEISIEYGRQIASDTYLNLGKIPIPELKASLSACYDYYGAYIGHFDEARKRLNLRDIVGVKDLVKSGVDDYINPCEKSLAQLSEGDKLQMSERNTEMIDISNIITDIANMI